MFGKFKFRKIRRGIELKYVFCDDWLIYAIDRKKNLYYVSTELWPEWEQVGFSKSAEKYAVSKYMLPIALKSWGELPWIKAYGAKFSYVRYFLRKLNLKYYLYYKWVLKHRCQ